MFEWICSPLEPLVRHSLPLSDLGASWVEFEWNCFHWYPNSQGHLASSRQYGNAPLWSSPVKTSHCLNLSLVEFEWICSPLEPGVRPTAVALRRLRRLLTSQRFTNREDTGVVIFVDVELPMNGFIVDIIAWNNAERFCGQYIYNENRIQVTLKQFKKEIIYKGMQCHIKKSAVT